MTDVHDRPLFLRDDLHSSINRKQPFSLLRWLKSFRMKSAADNISSSSSSYRRPAPSNNAYKSYGRGLAGDEKGYIFGVSLDEGLKHASVKVNLRSTDGVKASYGYVPFVVAKCGNYLKQNALRSQGIFRVSGAARRIKPLQDEFDTPPNFGQDINWSNYTVHDAASLLRRYLNSLPTPVIPLQMYWDFNEVLSRKQSTLASISQFRALIALLPSSSRYLLQYLIDMLALFAAHSEENLMTASNLAIVFQPGLVSSRSGSEKDLIGYPRMSGHKNDQEVVEFLIEHHKHFVFGLDSPETATHDDIERDYEMVEAHDIPSAVK